MKKLYWITLTFILLTSWRGLPENFMIGNWKSYRLEPFGKKQSVSDSLKIHFKSEITFYQDSTYKKIINGVITSGKYQQRDNHLIFYKQDRQGNWVSEYSIRWPHGGTDPCPWTKEVDILYPELLPVKNKKDRTVLGEVDVYYIKVK